jgi:hypothetical protein
MTSDLEGTRFDARSRVPCRLAHLQSSGNLSHAFLAMGAALAAFGLINAAAVAGGAWFGPVRWPVLRRTYAVVRD